MEEDYAPMQSTTSTTEEGNVPTANGDSTEGGLRGKKSLSLDLIILSSKLRSVCKSKQVEGFSIRKNELNFFWMSS